MPFGKESPFEKSGVGEDPFAPSTPATKPSAKPPKAKAAVDPYETMDPLNESEDDEGEAPGAGHEEKHSLKEVLEQVASGKMEVDFALSEIQEITGYDGE